ncbi:hypothetical protein RF11_09856 [Thelohanellus kitauei]|uniref:General transcription factor II-I repeat domain-containing protein 2 n=1 Tax=Thelohanellus kitauei TaxID=669202 RepID=A0A0C2NEY6_THEKT|nr:hypothetical protein RF11_09856 [Thelohanellus kitauei]
MSRDFYIKRKVDAENRQFQDKWTKDYYFVMNEGFPMCFLCFESLSVNYKRVKSSFLVSEKIAKHSKSFGEGEFIKECLLDISNVICPSIKTTMKDILEAVNSIFEKYELKWSSLSGICTDGVPSIAGVKKGFIDVVCEKAMDIQIIFENLTNFHCIIHQQNLCAKSMKFKNVMEVVVGCINHIKSRALNHSQFKEYLEDIFSEYENRFYDLRQEITDFLDTTGYKTEEIQNAEWVCDLAFLVGVTGYLNELNIELQKRG